MLESSLQNSRPPLLVGERAVWLGSGSGLPQGGIVRWMGKLQGMGPGWTVGLELDRALPYGGIDGSWCGRQLFQCRTKHGLLVPTNVVVKEDALLRTFGISPVVLNKPVPEPRAPSQQSISETSISSVSSHIGVTKPKRTKHASSDSRASQHSVSKKKPAPQPPGIPKPETRVTKPETQVTKSETQVTKPETQVTKPIEQAFKPETPVTKLETQVAKPETQITKLVNQASKPETQTTEPVPEIIKPERQGSKKQVNKPAPETPESIKSDIKQTEIRPSSSQPSSSEPTLTSETTESIKLSGIQPLLTAEKLITETLLQESEPVSPAIRPNSLQLVKPEEQVKTETSESPHPKPTALKRNAKAPLPPPKAGYFHTAPARPNRHLRGAKQPAPAVPSSQSSDQSEEPSQAASLPHGKETTEHAWGAAVAQQQRPCVPLRRHNSLNGPRQESSLTPDVAPATVDELIYQWFDASEQPPTAPPRHARFKPPMNNVNSPSLSPSSSSSSFEDAIAAADAIYSERFNKHFSVDSASSVSSNSSSNRKSGGGILSFLRWLRRGGSDTSDEKVNELSHAGSTNSLGTVVSAASSFAYVCPTAYNFPDNRASLHYAPSPGDSETYKYRIKQRDHARKLDKNLTLKRKYKLKQFACSQETVFSDTLKPSSTPSSPVVERISTGSGRRSHKRRAPPIPNLKSEHYSDCSLPASLEQRARRLDDMEDLDKPGAVKLHRRTASESSKDKKAGAYCHVRGKRRAPQPPANNNQLIRPNSAGLSSKFKNSFPSFGRKKRQAPSPPPSDILSETSNKLSNEEKQRLISNINKLKLHAAGRNDRNAVNGDKLQGPAVITSPPIVLNALHLQEGDPPPASPEPVVNKASMSPKPWYKRNSNKVAKVEKRVKKDEEEMPEVMYSRVLPSPDENKRKSIQLSMLASISELDREAAEIVQNQHKRAAELIAARNNSFYLPPVEPTTPDSPSSSATLTPFATTPDSTTPPITPDSPNPKVHTKGLISMFNAITNVSKVTVNTSTAAIAGFFNGDARKNRISQTFAIAEEEEEEDNSSATKLKITEVQSSSSQVAVASKVTSKENIQIDIKQARKDISSVETKTTNTESSSQSVVLTQATSSSSQSKVENKTNFSQVEAKASSSQYKVETKGNSIQIDFKPTSISQNKIENKGNQIEATSSSQNKSEISNKFSSNSKEITPKEKSPVIEENVNKISGKTNSIKKSLYPRLSAFEPKEKDIPKESPLPFSIVGSSESTRQKRIVWTCPRCTLENPRWRLTCDVCDMWRPSSMHEETVLPFEGSLHSEPKQLEMEIDKDNDLEELKPPEPIGAIDWEAELKRYFDPKDKKFEEKKIEPVKIKPSPLLNPKVEEAIKILEGKQPVAESPKLKSKINNTKPPGSPKLSVVTKKEPEYAALNKKMPATKVTDNKTPQPYKPPPVATSFSGGVIKNEDKKVSDYNKSAVPKVAVQEATSSSGGVIKNEDKNKNVAPKTPVKVAEAVKVADNFIGGRTKTDIEKTKQTEAKAMTAEEEAAKILSKEDVDEVRKARLAFFNKSQDAETTENKPPASPKVLRATQSFDVPGSPRLGRTKTVETATDTQELLQKITMRAIATPAVTAADREERLRLREKLKEMKNSLPKHAKPGEPPIVVAEVKKTAPPETSQVKKEVTPETSQGAIKKVTASSSTEVGYENVKSRRVLNRAVKVSTSVQTSGAIVARKPKAEEPVVEEPKNIKGGKLYTSLSKSPSFRGTGTFQLMGAKDFATIEATKSNKPAAPLQHVYANVPSPGLVQEATAEQTKRDVEPVKVEPVPVTPAPPVPIPTPAPAAQPSQVVVKVETQELELDDEEEAEMLAEELSTAGSLEDTSDIEKLAGLLTRPKGLAEFKADLAASPPQQQSNTLAVNRLLRRLEAAIASGQHRIAAGLARDLARLKISCSVVRQRKAQIEPELFTVDMYVEDKVSHQGPIPLSVCASMTVGELKVKVQQEFEIPANVQRWILGKQLASDDTKTLQQHSVAAAGCTVFLYLVAPPERADSSSPATEPSAPAPTPPPAEDTNRIVPTVEPPRGPGWYYNFEEDRYSYCESSDEGEASEPDEPEPPKPAANARAPPASAPVIKLAEPEQSESSSEEEEEEEGPGAAGGLLPTAPPATLPPEKKTGTLMLGWKCPVCTLINSPTRPGCAACTTERPTTYRVPTSYEASEAEAQRLRLEEELERAAEAEGGDEVDNYQALLALDNTDLVSNMEMFECPVCMAACVPGDGAVLRECLHAFCRACLAHTAQFSEDVEVRCPFRNQQYACDATLQDREVRALVPPDVYDRMQAKSVAQAENKIQNAFHCKTPDCRGWCIFEDNVNDFGCPVCGHHNCLTCQAIHDGINCRQYQERVTQASETDAEARRTKEMLEEMVNRGEALCCPTCHVVLMKKWGCDWLRCSMCKTEICWVTRGLRWGPGGKGDTSGGCKCGINGIKCHPKCNYCH